MLTIYKQLFYYSLFFTVLIVSSSGNKISEDNYVLNYIESNPHNCSVLIVRNDSILSSHNIDKITPLASTAKIIIAIEYAVQSSEDLIDPDQLVAINELEKFHIKNTDGNAHRKWLKDIMGENLIDSISIREI